MNIAGFRKEKNLTQAWVAEQLGVSVRTVSRWETGESPTPKAVLNWIKDPMRQEEVDGILQWYPLEVLININEHVLFFQTERRSHKGGFWVRTDRLACLNKSGDMPESPFLASYYSRGECAPHNNLFINEGFWTSVDQYSDEGDKKIYKPDWKNEAATQYAEILRKECSEEVTWSIPDTSVGGKITGWI